MFSEMIVTDSDYLLSSYYSFILKHDISQGDIKLEVLVLIY